MNENCLKDVMCPKCGHTKDFDIGVATQAYVTDDGAVLARNADMDWEEDSTIWCKSCNLMGVVSEFSLPGFYVTFDTVTEESAEAGESASSGWWEPGEWMFGDKPDEPAFSFDPEDVCPEVHDSVNDAIVEWAVSLLRGEGAMHPNTTGGDVEWWGTEGNEVIDFSNGETIRKSFHFHGFSDELQEQVNKEMRK